MDLDGKAEFGLDSNVEYEEIYEVIEEIGADGQVNILNEIPMELLEEANNQMPCYEETGDILFDRNQEENDILDVLNSSCAGIQLDDSTEETEVVIKTKKVDDDGILQQDLSNPCILGEFDEEENDCQGDLNRSVGFIDDNVDFNDDEVEDCLDLLNKSMRDIDG